MASKGFEDDSSIVKVVRRIRLIKNMLKQAGIYTKESKEKALDSSKFSLKNLHQQLNLENHLVEFVKRQSII